VKLEMLSTKEQIKEFFGSSPLIAASIRVTKSCNLRCVHCYANGGCALDKELKTSELKKVIKQFADLGVLHIFYTGGEPFIRPDMVDLLKYTDKQGLGILVSTNGELVSNDMLREMKDLDIKLFQISVDGDENTHNQIRGKKIYKNSLKLIGSARKILKKNVGVGSVMMKANNKQIQDIFKTSAESGADIYSLMLLILSGRAGSALNPTPKETVAAIAKLFKEYDKQKSSIKFANNTTIPPALVPKKWREQGIHETFALCSFPYCLGVESNGDVAVCDGFFNFPEMILGNIRENSIEYIWNNSKILKEIRKINPSDLKGACSKCIYKNYCAGGCRASAYNIYRDMTMPDPVCQAVYEAGLFPKDCLRD